MNGFEKSVGWSEKHSFRANHNRRQNELRHLALNGLFDVFRSSKGEKIAFPPPSPPCNVVPLFELPLENKKHPNFEWRGQGRGVDSYVSEVTLFEYNVSTILSPIAHKGKRKVFINIKNINRKTAEVEVVIHFRVEVITYLPFIFTTRIFFFVFKTERQDTLSNKQWYKRPLTCFSSRKQGKDFRAQATCFSFSCGVMVQVE